MRGAWAPNREPWGELECGCIVGMEFSVKTIGAKRKGWFNVCRQSGEWQRVISENVAWNGGGKCSIGNRLL